MLLAELITRLQEIQKQCTTNPEVYVDGLLLQNVTLELDEDGDFICLEG